MSGKIKLKDACKILNGFAFKSGKYVESGIRVIRITNVQKGYIEDEKPAYYPLSEESSIRDYMLEENDLLLSLTGNVGRAALLDKKWLPAALNQRVACLRIKDGRILKDYLYFALLSNKFEDDCIKSSKGIAQKNMSTEWLKDYEIPLPDKEKQLEIISSLKQLSKIIENKTRQIVQLDDLIKARFVEMFEGELKGDTHRLNEFTEVITKGTTPTTLGFSFTEEGINFIKIECITKDYSFIKDKMLHISEECNAKLKRSILKEGDILFSIAGAIGRTAIVTSDILPANTNQALAIIRLKRDAPIEKKFLNEMLNSDLIIKQSNNNVVTVAQSNLSLTDIGNFEIITPNIDKQLEYSHFVDQVDKSKFALTSILSMLEKLRLHLMI